MVTSARPSVSPLITRRVSRARIRIMASMVSSDEVLRLALACVLLLVVPGPSVVFIVGRALSYGRSVALATVAGNTLGCAVAAVCVAVGLGPVLQRWETLFVVVKLAGAAYLVWLGVQALRHSRETVAAPTPAAGSPLPLWRAVRAGSIVGLSNPKAFIIFAAILPPFVDRGDGHLTTQMLILAVVPLLIGAVTDSAWALAAGQARAWLTGSGGRTRAVTRVGGLSMIGLGISVAVTGSVD